MGIWLIVYSVKPAHRDEYLAWFHDVHIGEKLARDGYDWASHYEVQSDNQTEAGDHTRYVALFGGASTRVFYDPSPAQLKPTQDELTRKMIGCRFDVKMFIAATEWCERTDKSSVSAITSKTIKLGSFAASVDDQAAGAFCAQQLCPVLLAAPNCLSVSKLMASTGVNRHMVLQELALAPESPTSSLEQPGLPWPRLEGDDETSHEMGLLSASRIWPL